MMLQESKITFPKTPLTPYSWELGDNVRLQRDYVLDRNYSNTKTIKRGSGAWFMTANGKRSLVFSIEDVQRVYKEWTGKELTDGKQE